MVDVCIVGAGPVGLALAQGCAERGLSVALLESGSENPRPDPLALSAAEIVDRRHHADMEISVCRSLGGTSKRWGGRCVPFDPLDFESRAWVAQSGWPLAFAEIQRWWGPASRFLNCGEPVFDTNSPGWNGLSGASVQSLERWSQATDIAATAGKDVLRSKLIDLRLGHTAVEIGLDRAGHRVERVVAASGANRVSIQAERVVLAAGGLETTRLLLATRDHWPEHFGGIQGPLGRYYMGHISGKIAVLEFDRPADIDEFDFCLGVDAVYTRRRITLTQDMQAANGLLNVAFWPDNPPFSDPTHCNGTLSLAFLALAFPPLGRVLAAEAIRLQHIGPAPRPYMRHLANVLREPVSPVLDTLRIVRNRYFSSVPQPGFLKRHAGGRYALHYHAESAPKWESTVTLSRQCDPLGLPRLKIDLRFDDKDAQSVVRAHDCVDESLRAARKARLAYQQPREHRAREVLLQATDGFHQIGTARMGLRRDDSVVNPDCRVHDVDNLYVASSAIFPTSSQANPTLLAVALAQRLSEHLAASSIPRGGAACGEQVVRPAATAAPASSTPRIFDDQIPLA